jgi:hypothetical protein
LLVAALGVPLMVGLLGSAYLVFMFAVCVPRHSCL